MDKEEIIRTAAKLLSRLYPAEDVQEALNKLQIKNPTKVEAPLPPKPSRTAQELFGVLTTTKSRRHHRSKGPEFSTAELDDLVLLHAADKVVNNRSKAHSQEEQEFARRAARFAKQARKRRAALESPKS